MTAARTLRARAARLDAYGTPLSYLAFASLGDMASAAALCGGAANPAQWAGATLPDTLQRARAGDLPRVAPSDAMLEKVESMLELETLRAVTVPAVAGGVPCVPAYLAGHPMAMRTRRRVASDRGEIVLAIDGFTPAKISAESITRRGAAVLALARAAAMLRPVRLVSFAVSGGPKHALAYTLTLDSAPLDLARAAWVLGAPEFTRQMRLPIQAVVLGNDRADPMLPNARRFLCDVLGVTDESLVIAPGFRDGGALENDDAAVAWVRARIDAMTAAP
jgi:hypothetical protein